jgi:hypothetical protein
LHWVGLQVFACRNKMTVVAQLGIGARAKMQMAATGDRGFRLAAMLPRRRR